MSQLSITNIIKKLQNAQKSTQLSLFDLLNNIETVKNQEGVQIDKNCIPNDDIFSLKPDNINKTDEEEFKYIDATTQYLQDVIPYNPLSVEEEKLYGKLASEGDREAREKLISHNLKLVIHIAKQRVKHSPLSLEELIQAGNIGLIRAVDTYDYTKNNKFSTHAAYYIKAFMYREEENNARMIRLPVYMVQTRNKVNKSLQKLKKELNRDPSPEEIAKDTNLPLNRVMDALNAANLKLYSLNIKFGEDKENEGIEFFSDNFDIEEDYINNEEKNEIKHMLQIATKDLTELEKKIIYLRHVENTTYRKISKEVNLNVKKIKEIEENAMCILKEKLINLGIRNYF